MPDLGPNGMTLKAIDMSPEHLEMVRKMSPKWAPRILKRLIPAQIIFSLTIAIILLMNGFNWAMAALLVVACFVPISFAMGTSFGNVKTIFDAKQIQQRLIVFNGGVAIETLLDGKPFVHKMMSKPLYPWSLVSPVVEDGDDICIHTDSHGRLMIPGRCFETEEQREIFVALATP